MSGVGLVSRPPRDAREWARRADSGRSRDELEPRALARAVISLRYAGRPDRQPVVAAIDQDMIPAGTLVPTRPANERDARQHVSRSQRSAYSRAATAACREQCRA